MGGGAFGGTVQFTGIFADDFGSEHSPSPAGTGNFGRAPVAEKVVIAEVVGCQVAAKDQ